MDDNNTQSTTIITILGLEQQENILAPASLFIINQSIQTTTAELKNNNNTKPQFIINYSNNNVPHELRLLLLKPRRLHTIKINNTNRKAITTESTIDLRL